MSLLQNDSDIVRDGRQNTLKDAEVSLRDRLVQELREKLVDPDVNMGVKLSQAWSLASNEIATVLDKQQRYLRDLDEFDVGIGENKFGGNSNIHLPMAFTICKTYHSRFMGAILDIDPPFSLKARREDGTDKVQMIEDLMKYSLFTWCNEGTGIDEQVDMWIWNWCTTGTGIMKARWHTVWESWMDVMEVPEPRPPVYQNDDQGNVVAIPQWEMVEKEERVTVKTFEGPQFDFVQMEDFRMVGGEGDPDKADKIGFRSWWTASDLWTKVDQGIFNREAVERVLEGGRDDKYTDATSGLKQQRKDNSGQNVLNSDVDLDRYEIIEWIFKYDIDGSGINTDIVAWVDNDTSEVLGATYLRRLNPSGQRPYSVVHFHKRPGEIYGLGLLEILHPLTVELDAMHNIRIDNALYQSIPFFFYRAGSSLDPETFSIEPGMGIPVDNPATDVLFPNVGNRTPFTAQEESTVQSYIERLTGISDLSLGVMSGTQGATRTASGVRAILGENNNNLSVHLRRLNKGWKKVLTLLWHMLQTRLPKDMCFRVTGEDGQDVFYNRVNKHDLIMDVDFELNANSANSNKSVQIEVSQQVMSMAMNPINIQLGITGPNEIYAAQKSYLNNLGVKDLHRYLKKPADYFYALTPEEEFNRIVRKVKVPVHPSSDHQGFIAFAQSMIDQQRDFKTLSDEQIGWLADQMQAHAAMQQALDAQAAQQAVQQQMQFNAQQGAGQAPAALNPLAGADPSQLF